MNNSVLAVLKAMGPLRKVPSVGEGISSSLSISYLQHMQCYSGISQSAKLNKMGEFFVNQYSAYSYDINDYL